MHAPPTLVAGATGRLGIEVVRELKRRGSAVRAMARSRRRGGTLRSLADEICFADAMRPGPVLAALTEQAAGDLGRLTDNQVLGAMSAAGRLAARAEYLRLRAVAEFTRRREAQYEDATARGVPRSTPASNS